MLAQTTVKVDVSVDGKLLKARNPTAKLRRRLIAARDDTPTAVSEHTGVSRGLQRRSVGRQRKDRVIEEVRMRECRMWLCSATFKSRRKPFNRSANREVPVTYFSMGGWFYGITRGHALKNVFLRMEQFRLAREEQPACRSRDSLCMEDSQSSDAADAKSSGAARGNHRKLKPGI